MRELVGELAASGKAVLVSAHLLPEMQAMADRLVIIGNGHLVAEQDMYTFVQAAAAFRVQVPHTSIALYEQALKCDHVTYTSDNNGFVITSMTSSEDGARSCQAVGVMPTILTQEHRSLEDAFLTATENVVTYRAH